jgi:hypothetical protein
MIQMKILSALKKQLESEFIALDMYTADIRLAYAIYYAYMQEYTEILELRPVLQGAYELFKKNMSTNKKVDGIPLSNISFSGFERSVYRALEKAYGTAEQHSNTRCKEFAKLVEKVGS